MQLVTIIYYRMTQDQITYSPEEITSPSVEGTNRFKTHEALQKNRAVVSLSTCPYRLLFFGKGLRCRYPILYSTIVAFFRNWTKNLHLVASTVASWLLASRCQNKSTLVYKVPCSHYYSFPLYYYVTYKPLTVCTEVILDTVEFLSAIAKGEHRQPTKCSTKLPPVWCNDPVAEYRYCWILFCFYLIQ